MKSRGILWANGNLKIFLENPNNFVLGITIPFSSIVEKQDREALILYLEG